MSEISEFRLSNLAYTKMVLHALKYPHATVIGLLIADRKQHTRILDAVPLTHQCRSLIVTMETALCQVRWRSG